MLAVIVLERTMTALGCAWSKASHVSSECCTICGAPITRQRSLLAYIGCFPLPCRSTLMHDTSAAVLKMLKLQPGVSLPVVHQNMQCPIGLHFCIHLLIPAILCNIDTHLSITALYQVCIWSEWPMHQVSSPSAIMKQV